MLLIFRIAELFEIIVDYPDSEPALKDLAVCLECVEVKGLLISSLDKRFAIIMIIIDAHFVLVGKCMVGKYMVKLFLLFISVLCTVCINTIEALPRFKKNTPATV